MSFVDKRHRIGRGSMQGQCRYADITSDTSSAGGFMDETDREVSSLTDRAFRSLCIGEEAIYNDSELTSPAERHKAFAEETVAVQEMCSVGDGWGKAEGKPALATTFQYSSVQKGRQEHILQNRSCLSNGAIEGTWQQRRSRSRVSSLIQAFSSTGAGHGITPLQDGRHSTGTGTLVMDSEPWNRSGLSSFHNELSGLPATQFQDTCLAGNYFYSSSTDPAVTTPKSKTSTSRFRKLSSTNFFLHSEFSPFQTWKEYSKFQCQQDSVVNPIAHTGVPRWYDSPLYKELTAANTTQVTLPEEKKYYQKQNESRIPSEPPISSVLQKALAIEKRCESEMMSNCPPWRRNRTLPNDQLPMNRPCTVSPCSDKLRHEDEALLSACRASVIYHKVHTLVDETANSSASFNISQLLTPVIHPRQETETSEILQYECSPSHDPLIPKDTDPRMQHEVKQRDNYKAMASSLLFNLKDNRKRVKSTYSPTKFKSLEITDRSKQPSKQEISSLTDEKSVSGVHGSGNLQAGAANSHSGNGPVLQPTIQHTDANVSDEYLTLISPPTAKEAPHDGSFSKAIKGEDQLSGSQKSQYSSSPCVPSKSSEIPLKNKLGQPTRKQQKTSPAEQEIVNMLPREGSLHSIPVKDTEQGGTIAVNENNFIKSDIINRTKNVQNEMTGQTFSSGHHMQVKRNDTKMEVFTLNSKGKMKTVNSVMKEEVAARESDILSHPEMQSSSNASQGVLEIKEKYDVMTEPYVSLDRNNVLLGLLPVKQTENNTIKVTETIEKGHVRKEVLKFQSNEISQGSHEMLARRKNQPLLHSQTEGTANKGHEHTYRSPEKKKHEYSAKEMYTLRENSQATKHVDKMTEPEEAPVDSLCKRESGTKKQESAIEKTILPSTDGITTEDHQHGIKQGLFSKRGRTYNKNDTIDFKEEQSEAKQCLLYTSMEQPVSQQVGTAKENRSGKTQTLPREECSWVNQSLQITKEDSAHIELASVNKEMKATSGNMSAMEQVVETKDMNSTLESQQGINKMPANKTHEQEKRKKLSVLGLEEICQAAVQNEIVKNEAVNEGKRDSFNSKMVKRESSVIKETDRVEKEASATSESQSDGHALFTSKRDDQPKHTHDKREDRQSGFANKDNPKVKHKKFAFNERDYAMHEILTSKIKAHAQKEIFAIMEKGYAKWEAIATSEKESGAKRSLFGGRVRSNDHYGNAAANENNHTKLETIPRGQEKGDVKRAPPIKEREQNSKETIATDDECEAKNGHPVTKDVDDGKNEPTHIERTSGGQNALPVRENLYAQDVSNIVADIRSAKSHNLTGTEKEERNGKKEPSADPKTAINQQQLHFNKHAKVENSEINPKHHFDTALEQKAKSSPRQWSREKECISTENTSIHKRPDSNRETEHAESAVLQNNTKHALRSGKTECEGTEEKNEVVKADEGCLSKQATPTKGKREEARMNEGGISQEAYSLRETGSVQNGFLKVKNEGDGTDPKEKSREYRKGEELSIEKAGDKKEMLATIEKEFVRINVFAITRNADTELDTCSTEHRDTEEKHHVKEKRQREQEAVDYQDDSANVPQVKEAEKQSKQVKSEAEAKEITRGQSPANQIHAISDALATTEMYERNKQLAKEHGIREVPETAKENAKPLVLAEKDFSTQPFSARNGIVESFRQGDKQTDKKGEPATKENKKEFIGSKEPKKMETTIENKCINLNVDATKKRDGLYPLAKEQHSYPQLLENQNRTEPDALADEYVEAQTLPLDESCKRESPSITEKDKVFKHNKRIKDSTLKNPKSDIPGAKKHTDIEVPGAKEEANFGAITTHKSCAHAVHARNEKTKPELSATQSHGNTESNNRSEDSYAKSAIFAAKECNKSSKLLSPKEQLLPRKNITADVFASKNYTKSEVIATESWTNPDLLERKEWSKPTVLVQKETTESSVPARKEYIDPSVPSTADQHITKEQIKSEVPVFKEDHIADVPITTEPLKHSTSNVKECECSVPVAKEYSKPDVPMTTEPVKLSVPSGKELRQRLPVTREYKKPDIPVTTEMSKPTVPTRKECTKQSIPVTNGISKPDVPATAELSKPGPPIRKELITQSGPFTKENSKPDVPIKSKLAKPSGPRGKELKLNVPLTKEYSKSDVPVTAEVSKPSVPTGKELITKSVPATKGNNKPDVPKTREPAKSGAPMKEHIKQSVPIAKEYNNRDIPAMTETSKLSVPEGKEVVKHCVSVTKEIRKPDEPATEPSKPPPSIRKEFIKPSVPVPKEYNKPDLSVPIETSKPGLPRGKERITKSVPKEHVKPNIPMAGHSKPHVPVKTKQPKQDITMRKEHTKERLDVNKDSPKPGLPLPRETNEMEQLLPKEYFVAEECKVKTPANSNVPLSKELPTPEVHKRQENINDKPRAFPLKGNSKGEVKNEHFSRKDVTFPLSYPAQHPEMACEGSDVSYKHAFASKEYAKSNKEVFTDKEEYDKAGSIYTQRFKQQEGLSLERNKFKEQLIANKDHHYFEKDIPHKQRHAKTAASSDKGQRVVNERHILKHEVHTSSEKEKTGRAAEYDAKQKAANLGDRELSSHSSILPLQVNGRTESSGYLEQPVHTDMSTKPLVESYLSMEGAHQSLMKEPKVHGVLENIQHTLDERSSIHDGKETNNKEIEVLEYYALSNCKTDTESKGGRVSLLQTDEKMPRKGGVQTSGSEADESSSTHYSADSVKASIPTPQLDTLSPTMGKPTMFKVKDNTFRISPVTKAVKPRFHKTFPEDLQRGSPSSSEKGVEQQDQLAEPANFPAMHHAAVLSNRFPHARERMSHHVLSPSDFSTAKEGGCFRRNPAPEEDECCSVASAFSEDVESYAPSTVDMADDRVAILRNIEDASDIRDTGERPEVKLLGKPPVVPPKSEKALRRAQKLTSRRIKKDEGNVRQEGKSQVDQKVVRAVSSVPSSPTGLMESHRPMPGPLPAPRFCIETGYVAPAPNLVPQPFPLTQRKLLQDPNSGQYFVVDMPVQVKTKMFFDPETGKYVQLSVRQSPEGTLSPASSVELLNPPYMLYPGFLPMHVPSLPPLRSSSQMSAPAALVDDPKRPDISEPWRQKSYHQRTSSEVQPYTEPVYQSPHQLLEESSHGEDRNTVSPRNLNIISMSELEDFAVEST
ncbi:cardiac-enriched FHL2-interacting protein [Scleropages formosus]|uniref:cardiac-enriched FHL2-interacting protein n=1 Tax=Scleropages formosus TaxID=113540 RepID=UPI0010FAC98F|nr:uncharacterized protein LOC108918031 [Scleropages formosus]